MPLPQGQVCASKRFLSPQTTSGGFLRRSIDMSWRQFWYDRPVYQKIRAIVGVGLAVFHIYTALFGTLDALMQRSVHLGLGLILVFLVHTTGGDEKRRTIGKLDVILIAAVVVVISYIFA